MGHRMCHAYQPRGEAIFHFFQKLQEDQIGTEAGQTKGQASTDGGIRAEKFDGYRISGQKYPRSSPLSRNFAQQGVHRHNLGGGRPP